MSGKFDELVRDGQLVYATFAVVAGKLKMPNNYLARISRLLAEEALQSQSMLPPAAAKRLFPVFASYADADLIYMLQYARCVCLIQEHTDIGRASLAQRNFIYSELGRLLELRAGVSDIPRGLTPRHALLETILALYLGAVKRFEE
ncbi:hypothetical protein C4564_00230 [Candidatus Microgenomates bacterium]|nr:MAG: hypothetical protein C4564_00230 [Candidatus Microgenomates bacterium]